MSCPALDHTRSLALHTALALIALFGVNAALAYTVQDDQGHVLHFNAPPERIVSLAPALTESVCMLGQCARLVGVDQFSNWPEPVRHLPHLGGLDDTPIESVLALRPDVVLLTAATRIGQRLQSLGVPVLVLAPEHLADVQRVLQVLGSLLQSHQADAIWRDMDATIRTAAASVPSSAKGRKVYFEVSPEPYAASESSFIGELLKRLGVSNVVPASLGPFPTLNPEYVVRAAPEVIMVGDGGAAGLAQRPGWASIPALRQHKVCVFQRAQSDALVRPGPRMGEAAQLMAQCLRSVYP